MHSLTITAVTTISPISRGYIYVPCRKLIIWTHAIKVYTVQKVIRLHAHVHTHTHTHMEGQDYPFLTKPHGPSAASSCLLATCDNNWIRQLSAFP